MKYKKPKNDISTDASKKRLIPINKKHGHITKPKKQKEVKLKNVPKLNNSSYKQYAKESFPKKLKAVKEDKKLNSNHVAKGDDKKKAELEEKFSCLWNNYSEKSFLHIKSGAEWSDQLIKENDNFEPIPFAIRKKLKDFAIRVFDDDVKLYKIIRERKNTAANRPFHKAVLTHGTSKDKLSALAYICMENPVYSLSELQSLINHVDQKLKHNIIEAVDTIENLFQTTYLRNGMAAKEFECHDFSVLVPLLDNNVEQVEKQLVLWYFENQLRLAYLRLVENLEKLSRDTQMVNRKRAMKALMKLIMNHPKQDPEAILRKVVNKLGDANKKISGEALHSLNTIQWECPAVKLTVVSLVEEVLYRPNISLKAQYYALCFLNDITLKKKDSALTKKMITVYFDFFQVYTEKGEIETKFMGAILRGVNRAYPYLSKGSESFFKPHMAKLYKLPYLSKFEVASQAIQFLYQVHSSQGKDLPDKFYNLIYKILLSKSIGAASCSTFMNVIFKSMAKDRDAGRVRAFIKRLLQVSLFNPSRILCAALFLISEAVKDNDVIPDIQRGLLKKSNSFPQWMKEVKNMEEQSSREKEANINGESSTSSTRGAVDKVTSKKSKKKDKVKKKDIKAASVNQEKVESDTEDEDTQSSSLPGNKNYDALKSNLQYVHAEGEDIWELISVNKHFHPAARSFVSDLLKGHFIQYSGDPLEDYTLTRFLDRFIQRNPKKVDSDKKQIDIRFGNKSQYRPAGSRRLDVKSDNFKNLPQDKVAPEEVFLHSYFSTYEKRKIAPIREKDERDDDESSIGDDEFEEELRKMSGFGGVDDDPEDDMDLDDLDFASHANVTAEDKEANSGFSDDQLSDEGSEDEKFDEFEEEDGFDEEMDEFEDEDIEDDFGDFDDEDDYMDSIQPRKKSNPKRKKSSASSDVADPDEFSQILEGNLDDPFAGTSEAIKTRPGASKKEILWEKKQMQSDRVHKKYKNAKNNKKFKQKNRRK